jgi:PAS domain S-box-containing protein
MNLTPSSAQIRDLDQRPSPLIGEGAEPSAETPASLSAVLAELAKAVEDLRIASEQIQHLRNELATANESLERERQRYLDLFEFAPDACFVTDPRGVILEANRAVASLIGHARKYIQGKPLTTLIAERDYQSFVARLSKLRDLAPERTVEWEMQFRSRRHDDGMYGSVRVAAIRDPHGHITGLRWMIRDISAQKRTENDLLTLNADLEKRVRQRTAELEALVRIKDALLTGQAAPPSANREGQS